VKKIIRETGTEHMQNKGIQINGPILTIPPVGLMTLVPNASLKGVDLK